MKYIVKISVSLIFGTMLLFIGCSQNGSDTSGQAAQIQALQAQLQQVKSTLAGQCAAANGTNVTCNLTVTTPIYGANGCVTSCQNIANSSAQTAACTAIARVCPNSAPAHTISGSCNQACPGETGY